MAPTLGYWKIRGLAQPIRLLLEYNEQKYEQKLYERGPGPEYSAESWLTEKFNLGLPFPNLPYYVDGNLKLTQFEVILRYIAEKNGMGGKTMEERAVLAMLNGSITDLRWALTRVVYSPQYEQLKGDFINDLPKQLGLFSTYLGDKDWISGPKIDYPDFNLYDLLDTLKAFSPGCLDKFANLQKYLERFESLERIKSYMESDRFMKWPYNNKIALWGGDRN